ncbi:MAG: hypothetical protein GC206_03625 [Alphaproteobacteria bacterium]|nr:hypothetical protein [Alphaproteobacteria bacterium]
MRSFVVVVFLVMTLIIPKAAQSQDAAFAPERFGLYVLSDDLDRAAAFYERVFAEPPAVRTPALVGFDVAGGFYAIASRAAFAPDAPRGESTVPYIRVRDIDAEFERVRAVAPGALRDDVIVREGPISLFRFVDPDGNVIEFFALAGPPR